MNTLKQLDLTFTVFALAAFVAGLFTQYWTPFFAVLLVEVVVAYLIRKRLY